MRVDGTVVFLSSAAHLTPSALLRNPNHNQVLHRQNLFVNVKSHEVPWISVDERCEANTPGNNCWQVTMNLGFKDDPDIPNGLLLLSAQGIALESMRTSYFLSRHIIVPSMGKGMHSGEKKFLPTCIATRARRRTS